MIFRGPDLTDNFLQIKSLHQPVTNGKTKQIPFEANFLSREREREAAKMVMDRVSALLLSVLVLGCGYCFDLGHGRQLNLLRMRIPGDPSDCKGFQNSVEIESLARFAVQEHNKKQVFFFWISFTGFGDQL